MASGSVNLTAELLSRHTARSASGTPTSSPITVIANGSANDSRRSIGPGPASSTRSSSISTIPSTRPEVGDPAHRERAGHQLAQPRVLRAVGVQDRAFHVLEHIRGQVRDPPGVRARVLRRQRPDAVDETRIGQHRADLRVPEREPSGGSVEGPATPQRGLLPPTAIGGVGSSRRSWSVRSSSVASFVMSRSVGAAGSTAVSSRFHRSTDAARCRSSSARAAGPADQRTCCGGGAHPTARRRRRHHRSRRCADSSGHARLRPTRSRSRSSGATAPVQVTARHHHDRTSARSTSHHHEPPARPCG